MQHPIDFLESLTIKHGAQTYHILREYLQVMALQILYRMKNSEHLRFGGGTCLRICHNLPRYSEDLDFSLDKKDLPVTKIINGLKEGFHNYGVEFHLSVPKNIDKKRVAKYWLKFPNLLHPLGYSPHISENLAVKLEIDKHPPKKGRGEFFYVEKFKQHFPIFKNDLPTLFSGKIGAVCHRGYHAMRDFYDLLWYLNKGIEPNYKELQELHIPAHNRESLIALLREKTKNVDGKKLIETIGGFLENPAEKNALLDYPRVFSQAAARYLGPIPPRIA